MKKSIKQLIFLGSLFLVTVEAGNLKKYVTIPMMDGLHCIVPIETEAASNIPGFTQELVDTLSYMGNEERLAYDVYITPLTKYPNLQPDA